MADARPTHAVTDDEGRTVRYASDALAEGVPAAEVLRLLQRRGCSPADAERLVALAERCRSSPESRPTRPCNQCRQDVVENAEFCPHCGRGWPTKSFCVPCGRCGATNGFDHGEGPSLWRCRGCGASLHREYSYAYSKQAIGDNMATALGGCMLFAAKVGLCGLLVVLVGVGLATGQPGWLLPALAVGAVVATHKIRKALRR